MNGDYSFESNLTKSSQMISDMALRYFTENLSFIERIKGMPDYGFNSPPDTRSRWKKAKDRMSSRIDNWRHSLACWITPYGFDD